MIRLNLFHSSNLDWSMCEIPLNRQFVDPNFSIRIWGSHRGNDASSRARLSTHAFHLLHPSANPSRARNRSQIRRYARTIYDVKKNVVRNVLNSNQSSGFNVKPIFETLVAVWSSWSWCQRLGNNMVDMLPAPGQRRLCYILTLPAKPPSKGGITIIAKYSVPIVPIDHFLFSRALLSLCRAICCCCFARAI